MEREREITWIEGVRDGGEDDRTKRELLVRHAADEVGAFRLLDKFKSGRRHPRARAKTPPSVGRGPQEPSDDQPHL